MTTPHNTLTDKEYYQLTISIGKALNSYEMPVKSKHIRLVHIITSYKIYKQYSLFYNPERLLLALIIAMEVTPSGRLHYDNRCRRIELQVCVGFLLHSVGGSEILDVLLIRIRFKFLRMLEFFF
jgi:hypothetical protein